jgi:hypothetical protein
VLRSPRPRCNRVSVRHPLRGLLGASRIHALASLRRSSGEHCRHSHVPDRGIRDRPICPIRVLVLGSSQSRRAGCNHEWGARSRILFAVRQHSLFLAMETGSRFANRSHSVLYAARFRHPRN